MRTASRAIGSNHAHLSEPAGALSDVILETLQMKLKHAFVTMTAAAALSLSGLLSAEQAPQAVIEAAEAEAEAAAEIADAVAGAADEAQAEADAAVANAKMNKDSYAAQKAAEGASKDAALLKEAEVVTREVKEETKTEAMLEKQSGMIGGED